MLDSRTTMKLKPRTRRGESVQVDPRAGTAGTAMLSGTITYLFTDVESSTRAWLRDRAAMGAALARHDELIERVVANYGGQLVRPRGEGDSRFAVFARASDGVAAASALQRAYYVEKWGLTEPLRVRMAVHTGEAHVYFGDYYGPAVNHCARLRSVAHGGQVVVSAVTAALVAEALPENIHLRDLGVHELKDLEAPEHIWQVVADDLPSDFPPLVSQQGTTHNLPRELTSFVGRDRELEALRRLLASSRLLTLTGTGGVGKTRLALRLAEASLPEYPGGVWLAQLAPLEDAALVSQAVADMLGVHEERGRALTDTLIASLQHRRLLLVLDNCEHLVQPCAALAEKLLEACAGVTILATSREPLRAAGETTFRVPPLSVSIPAGADAIDDHALSEAEHLFIARARAAQPDFQPTEQRTARAIVAACARLDGVPLAIELAASRTRVMSVEDLVSHLDECFRFLRSGSRTASRRQMTLRGTVDWSYGLLTEPERTLFHRLSVFSGSWPLEAVAVVCADPDQADQVAGDDVLEVMAELVDQSLVELESSGGTVRYRLLETLRQYASERLRETGEEAAVRDRHLSWCLSLVESAWPALAGPQQAAWLARLELEHDNLRAGLAWSRANPVDATPMLQLAGGLYPLWWHHGHLAEGRAFLAQALELDARFGTAHSGAVMRARLRALKGAGILARSQSQYAAAESFFVASVGLARELGDMAEVADGLFWLSWNAFFSGDEQRADALANESLTLWRGLGELWGMAHPLAVLAALAWRRGDDESARALLEQRLRCAREAGDTRQIAATCVELGVLAYEQGQHDRALELLEISRELFAELEAREGMARVLSHIAQVARARGDIVEAQQRFGQSLTLYQKLGAMYGIAECLEGLSAVARKAGQFERAVQLVACAATLREAMALPLASRLLTLQEKQLDSLRSRLGAAPFEAAWQAGQVLSVAEAVALALTPNPASASGM